MPKKLNSITLSDRIIAKMRENIDIARDKKVESGFTLCKSNGDIHGEYQCSGTSCELVQFTRCEKGEFVGTFHTHPLTETVEPSITDMVSAYKYSNSCIGSPAIGTEGNRYKLKCFVRKGNINDETLDKLVRASIREILPSLRALIPTREIASQRTDLENIRQDAKKLFNIIDVI